MRRTAAELMAWLAREPFRFDFFRAVDLIERLTPGSVPVGEAGPAEAEAIRFQHDPSLIFHASDVLSVVRRDPPAGRPQTIVTTGFLGLTGVVSPLPMVMTEDVLAADAEDLSLRGFYDLIHHRILSLFYRAWRKHRIEATYDGEGTDPFTRRVLALVGVDVLGATPAGGVPHGLLLALAPLVATRNHSQRALEIALRRAFPGVALEVKAFVLRRTVLAADQRVTLGVRNCTLGRDMAIGRSVADRSGRFRVCFSGIDSARLAALSPGGSQYELLCAILSRFSGGILEAEVELELPADQVPRFRLGVPGAANLAESTRLGSTSTAGMRSRFVAGAKDARRGFLDALAEGQPSDA